MTISFEIKALPDMPNRMLGARWWIRSKHAKRWHGLVAQCVNRFRPFKTAPTARITLTRHSSREPDFDGLAGSFKAVIDGLVKCGVIEDDKISNIGQPTYNWVKAPPKKGKITVEVELT